MIMKTKFTLLFIAFLLCACNNVKVISQEQYMEYADQIGLLLPDSLKTSEQIAIKDKMIEIYFTKTLVKNDEMRLTVGRDYFVEQGLPAYCYDLLLYEQAQNNKFYKEWKSQSGGAINLEDVFKESQEEYLTQK
jgi:hypothetical protein